MKKFKTAIVLAALTISATLNGNASSLVTITTQASSETRQVSEFSGITSSGSFNVKVKMGTKESLKIEADQETLKDIETTVEKGVLIIRYKPRSGGLKRGKATVYVTAKQLNNLTVSGSGNIDVEGKLKSSHLSNVVSGSGSIVLTTETSDYTAVISGSGKISIDGKAKTAQINISGSGNFNGENLSVDDVDTKMSGSGGVSITANNTLDATLSGSGKIRYSGDAKVSQTKSGSGSISKI